MKRLLTILVLVAAVDTASAQNADDYRGGWRTADSDPHTYQFSIRGNQVRGVYCTRCADATTLAFVDGTLGADGLTFVVTHVRPDGSTAYQDRATARITGSNLIVAGTSGRPGAGKFQHTMYKDPRGPDPLGATPVVWISGPGTPKQTLGGRAGGPAPAGAPPAPAPAAPAGAARAGGAGAAIGAGGPGGAGGGGRGYVPPGAWKAQLTANDVAGVWLGFGVGVNKQFFIIRRVGDRLRGMVCGRCDNPYTMAALDDFTLKGDTLTFKIIHEDWGDWTSTFDKLVIARVALNEMRFTTEQDNIPEASRRPGPGGGSSLVGPIAIEATAGNDSRPLP
jgi:hypothetical protein